MFSFSPKQVQEQFVSAEQLMRVCDQVWSADARADTGVNHTQPEAGTCVYCKVDHLVGLFDKVRRSRNRIVLVSSESDRPITADLLARCPAQIAHWFSTNLQTRHERLSAIPLGLANSYCAITLKAPLIAARTRPLPKDRHWLYVNFRTSTNPDLREPVMNHFRSLKGADWVTVREAGLEFETFLEEMVSHRFVLCPPGNGIDTHRLWEALYCQTIPVALANPGMDSFRDLPILFVNSFEKLTRDFLESEYERMASAEWNWPRLFLPWWRDRIRAQKEKLQGKEATISRGEFLQDVAEQRLRAFKRRVLRSS